jgi:thiamine biosynthesis lipoprotein
MKISKKINKTNKIIIILCVLMACMLFATGCGNTNGTSTENVAGSINQETVPSDTKEFFAMDTYMTITAYGEDAEEAVAQAQSKVEELDDLLSTGQEDSEVSILNQSGDSVLSEDAFYLMTRALEIWNITDGAFNPAVYPLMEKWGFTTGEYQVPTQTEVEALLENINPENIQLDEDTGRVVFTEPGMEIDFGGIAKGYTSAQIMNIFKNLDIVSGMVSLGGNVQVYGCKTDGSLWRVAIQNPDSEEDYLGILEIQDKAVITSGGYERYFEQDGKVYHHIIDPATGYPAENGLKSVTIVSEDGVLADGLSTALFVMGTEQAKEFWKDNGDDFDVILLTDNDELYISEGIEDVFESDYTVEVIRRD